MEFDDWYDFYRFKQFVTYKTRYIYQSEIADFLEAVKSSAKERTKFINKGSLLWRAQIGSATKPYVLEGEHVADIDIPFSKDRMRPLIGKAVEGRVNPKGIPCIYLAKQKETAMAEVRPWKDTKISVARFSVNRELEIVDCSKNHDNIHFYFLEGPKEQEKIKQAIWSHIDFEFSRPIQRDDSKADYASTQILSELFRSEGLDGVAYGSSLFENGLNIALFNHEDVTFVDCELYKLKKLSFDFKKEH